MTFKRTRCPCCKGKLDPGQRIHPGCISAYAEDQAAKAKRKEEKQARMAAKVERAETRRRKEAIKTRSDWLKDAQKAFNAFVRERDKDQPCICCGRFANDNDLITGSRWDAGHYRSTGSAPHLRFDERNVHRQLVQCNRHGAGRAVDYRIGLIARIGIEAVEALEADNTARKWTIEDLRGVRDLYRAKLKALREAA